MIFPNHYNQRIWKNLLMQSKNQSVMQVGDTLKDNKWHDLDSCDNYDFSNLHLITC